MRFNGENGGTVIQAPVDLDTNRTEILARVDSLDTDSYTTLAETIFESALLWQGLPAHYGELFNKYVTDPRALASSSPEKYLRPEIRSCAKNFNVLLSDGEPSRDAEVPELLGQLPGYATVMGSLGCTGTGDGACLPDVAEYLSRVDIDPTLEGHQSVITHTIGFTQNIPILEDPSLALAGLALHAEVAASTCSLRTPTRCSRRCRRWSRRSTNVHCRFRRLRFPSTVSTARAI